MTVFDKVLERAMPVLIEIESARPKHWNESFRWLDFVRIMVYYFTKRSGSLRSLTVALATADPALHLPTVPQMTLSDASRRFRAGLLRAALARLLAEVELEPNPELALIGQVHAVDGSEFPLIGSMTWFNWNSVTSAVKLHLNFNLTRMLAVDFIVGPADSSERDGVRQMLEANVTYVLDRGYLSFKLYRDIIAREAHVVVRAYNNLVVETVQELPVALPERVHRLWKDVRDRVVRSNNAEAEGLEFRLVELTVGSTHYKLLTNRLDLTTFQVILLYAYRWQIELILRYFKHTMNGIEVIFHSKRGIENFFAAMFLTALLHIYFKVECLERDGHLPPSEQETLAQIEQVDTRESPDYTRPTAHLAIAYFMAALNQKLALFWKVSKHWLATLSECLHRPFSHSIVRALNKQALAHSHAN